jgi:hypothetical protein
LMIAAGRPLERCWGASAEWTRSLVWMGCAAGIGAAW